MDTRQLGYGTCLEMGDGADPEVFTEIAEIQSFNGPDEQVNMVEVTHLKSAGAAREFLPGLLDSGQLQFDAHLLTDDPTHDATTGYVSKFKARTEANFRLKPFGMANMFSFAAIVESIGHQFEIEGVQMQSVSLKITGPITIEATA